MIIIVDGITHWDEHEICDNLCEILGIEYGNWSFATAGLCTPTRFDAEHGPNDIRLTIEFSDDFIKPVKKYLKKNGYNFRENPINIDDLDAIIKRKEQARLDINVFGKSREKIISELHEDFALLWKHYALADDVTLTKDAIELKKVLLETFDEFKPVKKIRYGFENYGNTDIDGEI